MRLTQEQARKLIELKDVVAEHFNQGDWLALGSLTESPDIVANHPRLLRSLHFGDPDYPASVLEVLLDIARRNPDTIAAMEEYACRWAPPGPEHISSGKDAGRAILFKPTVFEVPGEPVDERLVSVMMPFSPSFDRVYQHIEQAVAACGLTCHRADNVWEHSAIIQDIFSLIFRSAFVICDFSGKNPNVFYETGLAHALGKLVIPITQRENDIPFDIRHHRYLLYQRNRMGLEALGRQLGERLSTLDRQRSAGADAATAEKK